MTKISTITTSAQAIAHADVPKRSEAEWAEIIRDDLGRAVEGIIAAGEHLRQAKYQLEHGRFLPLLRSIGLHERTAERLMKIASNVVLANPTHGSKLPTSMRTLYELSTLPLKVLEAKIIDGTITPDIERNEVERLKGKSPRSAGVPAIRKLQQENAALKTDRARLLRAGEDFFAGSDTATDIARTITDHLMRLSPDKARTVLEELPKLYRAREDKPARKRRDFQRDLAHKVGA